MPNENNPLNQEPMTKGQGRFTEDDEQSGSVYSANLESNAEEQVRATEDASLQDDTYAFDEDNTDNEDIHDVDDFGDVDSLLDS
jgi:hypothetical protein